MVCKQIIEQEKHTVERKISRTMFGDEHLSTIQHRLTLGFLQELDF